MKEKHQDFNHVKGEDVCNDMKKREKQETQAKFYHQKKYIVLMTKDILLAQPIAHLLILAP
jgi:hypothetical protein